jgi:hypothetical protein
VMKWISVEDRLPSETSNVVGFIEGSDGKSIERIKCYICPEYKFVIWETLDDEDVEGWVTHWMPMPKPPTGEE